MTHFKNTCPNCSAVSQCRCPSTDKIQTKNVCPTCTAKSYVSDENTPTIDPVKDRGHKSTYPCDRCKAMEVYAKENDDDCDVFVKCYGCGYGYWVDGIDS